MSQKGSCLFSETGDQGTKPLCFVFHQGILTYEVRWGGLSPERGGEGVKKRDLLPHPELGGLWDGAPLWSLFLPREGTLRSNEKPPQKVEFWSLLVL